MDRQEVEKQISEKIREIWEIYHGAYPEGTYLSVFIMDGDMYFHNSYFDKDKSFPVEHFESLQESQE